MEKSQEWIAGLNLKPHPEGGFYNEVYRSQVTVEPSCLPDGFSGKRHISTSIYYLLRAGERSVLHRLLSDEIWYFHAGDPLTIVMLDRDKPKQVTLGSDVSNGQLLQFAIPAGAWFGAFVPNPGNYALCSCQVSPGFDFDDFEIGMRAELINMFPSCRTEIEMLTNI